MTYDPYRIVEAQMDTVMEMSCEGFGAYDIAVCIAPPASELSFILSITNAIQNTYGI